MATGKAQVRKDLKEAKKNRSVSDLRVVDGKITVRFINSDEKDWHEIPKVFDNWDDFKAYAEAFFE